MLWPMTFGGQVGWIEPNQKSYWTVMIQPAAGGTPDTVLYGLNLSGQIVAFDDDTGTGRMEAMNRPWGRDIEYFLVGAYSTSGTTDVLANDYADSDGDDVGDALEDELGTCNGATYRPECVAVVNPKDSDHDGLPDADEVFGYEIPAFGPSFAQHLPAWGADPRRKDVFIEADWAALPPPEKQWNPTITTMPLSYELLAQAQGKFASAPKDDILNLVGDGIWLHVDIGASGDPCPADRSLCGAWGGGGERLTTHDHSMHPARNQRFRHLLIFPEGGQTHPGILSWTFDAGLGWAGDYPWAFHPKAVIHELGHVLGLTHGGFWRTDSLPHYWNDTNCKPNYPSLMSYAYDVGDWATEIGYFNFSLGQNPVVLDPARISESVSFPAPFDATRLGAGAPHATSHGFPFASAIGVDWNRDGVGPESGAVRGSLIQATSCLHATGGVVDEVVPPPLSDVRRDVSPVVAAFGTGSPVPKRLYVLNVDAAGTSVLYRHSPHSGETDRGGCSVGTGALFTSCHDFSSGSFLVPPGSTANITGLSALPWKGKFVVAYRGDDRRVFVNVASATLEPSGALTGWGTPRLVADDVDSTDIQLAPMYVQTGAGTPAYPSDEVLALFYTTSVGGTSYHRFRTTDDPLDPLAAWSPARVVTVQASPTYPMAGTLAPGVAVWPAPSATGPSYSATGYACGAFPDPLNNVRFLCYRKAWDRWDDATSFPLHTFARPSLVFHTLRQAAPPGSPDNVAPPLPGSVPPGQWWLAVTSEVDTYRFPVFYASTIVTAGTPPDTAGFTYVDQSWTLWYRDSPYSLYADRDLSAIKGLGIFRFMEGAPPVAVARMKFAGILDGAYHASLSDANDFRIMEQGICMGLHDADFCGLKNKWDICFERGAYPCPY